MEATVLEAKNRLSELLRAAEEGQEVIIRRGHNGPAFKLVPMKKVIRNLDPDPRWYGKVFYKDEDIWASEWKDENE